jgi:hypothetical protein
MPCRLEETTFTIKERTSVTNKGTSVTKERTSVTDKGTLLANFDQWMRICWGFEIKWICFRISAFSISAFPGSFQKMDAIPEMGQSFAENGKIVYRETSPLIF